MPLPNLWISVGPPFSPRPRMICCSPAAACLVRSLLFTFSWPTARATHALQAPPPAQRSVCSISQCGLADNWMLRPRDWGSITKRLVLVPIRGRDPSTGPISSWHTATRTWPCAPSCARTTALQDPPACVHHTPSPSREHQPFAQRTQRDSLSLCTHLCYTQHMAAHRQQRPPGWAAARRPPSRRTRWARPPAPLRPLPRPAR